MARNRILLTVLLFWALAMIVPDLARLVRPLGSFGFYSNNNGLIYDVTGPFADKTASPAWKAGVREGDRLNLSRMRCFPYDAVTCGSVLAALGGLQFVVPGRSAALDIAPTSDRTARQVTLVAEERPVDWLVRAVLLLTQIAGIVVVLAAAWLVWTRPGGMSWGFFLYVMWFNPGQSFEYYALLQQWPVLLLAQNVAGSVAQAAGYAGLLLFVIRVPTDQTTADWRSLEHSLPLVAAFLSLVLIASYGGLLGYRTEMETRAAILMGFVVDLCALTILMVRRRTLAPEDYQRVRWVIWGCLIGLPAFIIAELGQETTFFRTTHWGNLTPPEHVLGLLYLVNGILCLFVFEAVRSPRVVNVSIPLRRVTILGLTLSMPVLLLHSEVDRIHEHLELPNWAWLGIGAVVLFLISRLHEIAVELADRYFNRTLDRAEAELGQAILRARTPAEVERLLADEPFRLLKLASAAAFRRTGPVFRRFENGDGWEDCATRTLPSEEPTITALSKGASVSLADKDADSASLPSGLRRPILAVPAASRIRCFAITLYGPHASGADLDTYERAMLGRLGDNAADAYAELENDDLRKTIGVLEEELSAAKSSPNPETASS
jgi:hypothetical protein